MKYIILREDTENKLSDKINEYLAQGWKLHGYLIEDNDGFLWAHAMTFTPEPSPSVQ